MERDNSWARLEGIQLSLKRKRGMLLRRGQVLLERNHSRARHRRVVGKVPLDSGKDGISQFVLVAGVSQLPFFFGIADKSSFDEN